MKALIHLEDVSKHYGSQIIFESVTAAFYSGQKIGVIGRNGSGKSTLARLITGEEEPDSGRIVRTRDLRLSYLEQQDPFERDETALAFLLRYTDQEEWRCGEVAGRFQLRPEHLDTHMGELSGGYQTRVKLAAMLLREPNFLVMDEPTNYLDLSTLLLLEEFLRDFRGGYMIISHDREFLLRTCDQTLEAERNALTLYPGNVEAYLAFKAEQIVLAEKNNKVIDAKARQLQVFIDKHRVRAGTASQAQNKIKQLERLNRGKIAIAHAERSVRIRIPSVEPRNGTAVRCSDLSIGYPERTVASGIRFDIERGERIAILGDNGQGKTTLMRTLAGDLAPLAGECGWSSTLRLGYYAQHVYAALDGKWQVQDHLRRMADRNVPQQTLLDLAGSFLFQGDDVRKPISVLSGGERARLCLLGILLTRSPVLLLDEPTNHLDFETVEALAEALQAFEGTLFFISHDRTFVSTVATAILDVKNGTVKRYPGTYGEYVEHLNDEPGEAAPAAPAKPAGASAREADKPSKNAAREVLRLEVVRLRKRVQTVEAEIETAERERADLLAEFEREPTRHVALRNRRLKDLEQTLQKLEATWLDLEQQIETREAEIRGGESGAPPRP